MFYKSVIETDINNEICLKPNRNLGQESNVFKIVYN